MAEIELITFDLDDTVWPCAPVIEAAEKAHLAWLRERAERLLSAHDVHSIRAHRTELALRRPDIAHDITALREASLAELLAEFGYEPALAGEAVAVFLEARHRVEPYEEAPGVLSEIGRRYTVAALTNGNADVRRTPLAGLFHFALSAADVGAAKPEPTIFEAALERAGVPAEKALHVGDHPDYDIEAARRVGMGTIWVNRAAMAWPGHLRPPDAELTDLRSLLQTLAA